MTTTLELERPKFDQRAVSSFCPLMADEIGDLSTDALDAVCSRCRASLSWGQWIGSNDYRQEACCHSCGQRIFQSHEWTMPGYQQQLVEAPGYFSRRWYHASKRENWAEVARDAAAGKLLVHAGSKLSALSRADLHFRDLSNWRPVFLYSFEIRSTAEFSTTIYDDMGEDWPDRLGDGFDMRVCHSTAMDDDAPSRWEPMGEGILGVPYYNRYEVPGEISILFSALLIDLDSVEVVDLPRYEDDEED